jgi:hypothetical protein
MGLPGPQWGRMQRPVKSLWKSIGPPTVTLRVKLRAWHPSELASSAHLVQITGLASWRVACTVLLAVPPKTRRRGSGARASMMRCVHGAFLESRCRRNRRSSRQDSPHPADSEGRAQLCSAWECLRCEVGWALRFARFDVKPPTCPCLCDATSSPGANFDGTVAAATSGDSDVSIAHSGASSLPD